jgi:hypothetical protein
MTTATKLTGHAESLRDMLADLLLREPRRWDRYNRIVFRDGLDKRLLRPAFGAGPGYWMITDKGVDTLHSLNNLEQP